MATSLNSPGTGPTFTWSDHARDVASFVQHYLPAQFSPVPLPTVLERQSERSRRSNLVGVGHSFSGNAWLLAELDAATKGHSIWDGLILVDPMVRRRLYVPCRRHPLP